MVDSDAEPLPLEMKHLVLAEELGVVGVETHQLPRRREQEVRGVSAHADGACARNGQARGDQRARASFEVQALETVRRTAVRHPTTVDVDLQHGREEVEGVGW